ncbi:MAG: VWA domain-containing protein, partial [Mesorhizobium sp.]
MINYFPYDWKGPESASTPFNSTVSVMPTPWNTQTKLMHVAIKGFDVKPTEQPKANLVFLIDVSGSMD